MVFYPPAWVPKLPIDPPDSIPIEEFMNNEIYGRQSHKKSKNPFTCGLTGRTYSRQQMTERTDFLARALGKLTGWKPNEGIAWDKVACVFSLNTVDYVPTLYSIHRFSGIATPANAAYSADELTHQLRSSGATVIFTCVPLLETALKAAQAVGIPNEKVILLPLHGFAQEEDGAKHATVEDLIAEGAKLPKVEPLRWTSGQGARQPAFLCYSSGTSGLPKAVMISHRNVIANTLQHSNFERPYRLSAGIETQSEVGLLPFSHIYALVVLCHTATFSGDEVVVLPRFELDTFLAAIQRFKIALLRLVPPIVIRMLRSQDVCTKYDLSSITSMYSGAAPLGEETVQELRKIYPKWQTGQGYGMTETATVVCTTSYHDVLHRSSGSLVPGTKAKLIGADGKEVTDYDTPGELWVQSPSVTLGYLNNEKATTETFIEAEDGRWIRTGDEVVVTLSEAGNEHLVVVDRIKELIKVKGHQVAPAELEAHLLTHPAVSDTAVIQVPDEAAGEVPKAFVVRTAKYAKKDETEVAREIAKHVEGHKAKYKWLKGGIEFVDEIPKSPSGKILRRLLRDKERESRRKEGPKL